MRFLTTGECDHWLARTKPEPNGPLDLPAIARPAIRCAIPFSSLRWFSRFLITSCQAFDEFLVWPTEHGIWPSTENLHLYYRLRQSYGDLRLLEEAPGHLFLNFEFEDAATFVQLCLMSLWDTILSTDLGVVTVRLSHDEYVEFCSAESIYLEPIRDALIAANVEIFEQPGFSSSGV